MNIVGFNFTKFSAERKRSMTGQVKINNNIKLDDIREAKIGIGKGDKQAIQVRFIFHSEYAPKMALLEMHGDVLMLLEKKDADKVVKDWKDKRQIPSTIAQRVMNHILDRCNIQGLLFAKDLNLPSPVPLPKVNVRPPTKKGVKKVAKKAKKK